MTVISERIDHRVSYRWGDWTVTQSEMRGVLTLLRTDPDFDATIEDLDASGGLYRLFDRVTNQAILREIVAVMAARARSSNSTIRAKLRSMRGYGNLSRGTWSTFSVEGYFNVARGLARKGRWRGIMSGSRPAGLPVAPVGSMSGFSGAGATGVNPTRLPSIPAIDQLAMALGDAGTLARYSNPIGDLGHYLALLGPRQRLDQAKVLIRQEISTVFPHVYMGRVPRRSLVMHAAGRRHKLEPELIAAIILAEQRDQSTNEDAVDYQAAISIRKNTSIGLGQVEVSTARRYDLFRDLLWRRYRKRLGHLEIATLLASDEFNIFAAARYIRLVANAGARLKGGNLTATTAAFPGLDAGKYSLHSKHWPFANVEALASEYTSKPWDKRFSSGWAWFVGEAYRTIKRGSLAFP